MKATFRMTNARGRYRYVLLHICNRLGDKQRTEYYEFRSTENYATVKELERQFLAHIKDPFVDGDQTVLIDLSEHDPKNLPCLMREVN